MPSNVQIFHFNLEDEQYQKLKIHHWLDERELKRASGFLKKTDQLNYKLQRYLIKTTLKKELGLDNIKLDISSSGKPYLVSSNYHFNISHSKNHLLLGLNAMGPIGVDIECPSPKRNILNLAKRLFNDSEQTRFFSLNKDEQIKYFYQIWTQKEAYLKYLGTGINQSLSKINFLEIRNIEIKTITTKNYTYSWAVQS